jgi:hypothetical protein
MEAEAGTRMERQTGKARNNWVIAVVSRKEQHQEIILSAIAKRAYELFERRGCAHGFDLEDWITAENECLQNDCSGNTSQFDFFIESPRDPEVTTILSITAYSMIVFRTHARHVGETGRGPDVVTVHVFPAEIDTTQADVNRVDELLHVQVPKKNYRGAS